MELKFQFGIIGLDQSN